MRLNLNFKDSNIKRISQYEFEIVFDLSNMIKPRLSENVRMYIEHFNICEFFLTKSTVIVCCTKFSVHYSCRSTAVNLVAAVRGHLRAEGDLLRAGGDHVGKAVEVTARCLFFSYTRCMHACSHTRLILNLVLA